MQGETDSRAGVGLAWLPIDERQQGPLELEPQLRLDVRDRCRAETEAGSAHG